MNEFIIFEIIVFVVVFLLVYYIGLLIREVNDIYLLLQEHEFRLQEHEFRLQEYEKIVSNLKFSIEGDFIPLDAEL